MTLVLACLVVHDGNMPDKIAGRELVVVGSIRHPGMQRELVISEGCRSLGLQESQCILENGVQRRQGNWAC